jgi:hypothetical protein
MKKMCAAALTAMMLMTAGTALAAEFPNTDLSGDIKFHYRWNTYDWDNNKEGGKVWFRLNAKTELSDNVDAFARLAIQKLTNDHTGADFSQSYYDTDAATAIDRFGVVIKGKNFNYTVGRQGVTLGNGLLLDTNGYMGIGTDDPGEFSASAIDGLSITGKAGATSIQAVAGKAWMDSNDDAKVYALYASYSPAKDWTLGATLARASQYGEDANFYGANVGYTFSKAGLFADYAKSNADDNDTAYALGLTYSVDKKNSAYVIYSKVEGNADIGNNMTTYDDGGKGMYYGFDHKLTNDKTLSLFYKDMKLVTSGEKYDSLRATLTVSF